MRIRFLSLLALTLVLAAGCGEDEYPPAQLSPLTSLDDARPTAQAAGTGFEFGMELYRVIADRHPNFVISPYAMSRGLGAVAAGARGATADSLHLALRYPADASQVATGFRLIDGRLPYGVDTTGVGFASALALWGRENLTFDDGFLDIAREFGLEPETSALGNRGQTAERLNAFLEQHAGRVTLPIDKGDVPGKSCLVVAGTAEIVGHWLHPFVPRQNLPKPFWFTPTDSASVQTVRNVDRMRMVDTGQGSVVELPYVDRRTALYVAVPLERDGLPALEASMSVDSLQAWTDSLDIRTVDIQIPEFDLRTDIDWRGPLRALGLGDLFEGNADLSGLSDATCPLSAVIFPARYRIDVFGSGDVTAVSRFSQPRVEGTMSREFRMVHFDRPFLFWVRDRTTGAVLLLGRVTEPDRVWG